MRNNSLTGFTLIEILVTTVIILGIFVSIAGILQRSISMREKGSDMVAKARIGTALISLIRRDLNAMAFYPMKRSIYFSLASDRDGMGNRRDTLSFDALVPYITESGVTIYRFGRITYSVEEQFGNPDVKKLIRRTVFINNEYVDKGVEEIIEKEMDKITDIKSFRSAMARMEADDEKSKKDAEALKKEKEIFEKAALEHGLQETVLSRRIASFSVDVLAEEGDDWREVNIENRVPSVLKVTISMSKSKEPSEEIESEEEQKTEFSSIIRPVIVRYVSNTYPESSSKTKRPVPDRDKELMERMRNSMRSFR